MGMNVETCLVFEADVRHPVVIRNRLDVADFVGSPGKIPAPGARIWRDAENAFQLEAVDRAAVAVNGKGIPARPLRDGDEIVLGNTVAIFRQALAHTELDAELKWEYLISPQDVDCTTDAKRIFDTILLNSGLPRESLQEHVVEDWRATPIDGPHFGFGRVRSFWLDPGLACGIHHSRWDVVGSGQPTLMRQRFASIGLPGAALKWELSRRSREHGAPFRHDVLVLGVRGEAHRRLIHDAVRARFGRETRFGAVTDQTLWNLHHTDRILGLPGHAGRAPDDGIYCTISRL